MNIEIQGYWGAKVKAVSSCKGVTPEEYLKKNPQIHICDIVIDGKIVGTIGWDGKQLSIERNLHCR